MPPTCVSLFTGAGGLDLGLEAAGFVNVAAVEMMDAAVATLKANRERWGALFHGDITRFIERVDGRSTAPSLLAASGLNQGDASLLAGGPPCQPFSKSGYWATGDAKRLNDPRANTLEAYFDVLGTFLPGAFLLENVPGLKFTGKSEGIEYVERRVEALNKTYGVQYEINFAQLNAAEYGIPQARERVFVIGHRGGKRFEFPTPTHVLPPKVDMANCDVSLDGFEVPEGMKRASNAWDAIGHLEDDDDPALAPRGRWAPVLATIPEGFNYQWHTAKGGGVGLWGWRTRYYSMLAKIAKNRPSWTLTAKPGQNIGPFHWKSRRFSTAELKALQTLPSDYVVLGDVLAAHLQLGNAVPSAMAEILGREMRRQFFDEAIELTATLLPTQRDDCPAPEDPAPASSLPAEILALAGDHAEHPGTGRGPGARARESRTATSP